MKNIILNLSMFSLIALAFNCEAMNISIGSTSNSGIKAETSDWKKLQNENWVNMSANLCVYKCIMNSKKTDCLYPLQRVLKTICSKLEKNNPEVSVINRADFATSSILEKTDFQKDEQKNACEILKKWIHVVRYDAAYEILGELSDSYHILDCKAKLIEDCFHSADDLRSFGMIYAGLPKYSENCLLNRLFGKS